MSRAGAVTESNESRAKVRRRDAAWPVLLAVLILLASGREAVAAPTWVPHQDKIIHFFIFGLLATLVIRVDSIWRNLRWRGWLAIVLISLFGVADEFRQSFTPGRFVEIEDWAADTLGAIVAVTAYQFWGGYRAILEKPLRTQGGNLASKGRIRVEHG